MTPVLPKCLALILCDAVTRFRRTRSPSVVGVFEVIDVPAVPGTSKPFSVWLQLTDGHGLMAMEIIIEHVPPKRLDPETVVRIRFSLDFGNPNAVVEHEVVLHHGIELKRFGRYRLRLSADGSTIAQRYFVVEPTPPRPEEP